MAQKVLVAGGTGFIGRSLVTKLKSKGHEVVVVSRKATKPDITWDNIKESGIPECNAIIALQGESIAKQKWTDERKKLLLDSRVETTKLLIEKAKNLNKPPKYIATSAIGYYPTERPEVMDETYDGPVAANFAGTICKTLEDTVTEGIKDTGIKAATVRMGVVMGDGGALAEMALPFGLYAGQIGNGTHYFPWIHLHDAVSIYEYILNNNIEGIVNAVGPKPATSMDLANAIRACGKITIPAPAFMMQLMLGESSFLLTEGQKLAPKRMLDTGFKFEFDTIEKCMKNLLG